MQRSEKPPERRRLIAFALPLAALGLAFALFSARALPVFARARVAEELSSIGFPDARFELHLGWRGVWLEDVVLAPDLRVDRVALELDLFGPRLSAVTLIGARFTSPLASLAESSLAGALERAEPSRGGPAPPTIRLVRSRVELVTDRPERIELSVDGEADPATGRARFRLGSPLGEHDVALRWRESGEAHVVDLHARGGGDELDAEARLAASGALSVRAQAALAPGPRRWASQPVTTEGISVSGSLSLDEDARIGELDLRAEAARTGIGTLEALDVSAQALTREGAIEWEARAEGGAGLRAHAAGTLGLDPAAWEPAFAWTFAAPLPAELVNRAGTFFAVEDDPQVALSGHARQEGDGWIVDSARGHFSVGTFEIPDAELVLNEMRAELVGSARVGPGGQLDIELDEGSRLESAAFHLDALHLDALEASLPLRITHDRAGLRVHAREPLDLSMARLAIGEGESALSFGRVSMVLESRGSAPIATSSGEQTRLEARMRATAPTIAGLLVGKSARARSDIAVVIHDDEKPRIDLPLEVRASRLGEPESEMSLAGASVTLPLRWREGEVHADGRMRAERLAWRAIPVGPASGAVRLADDVLQLDWRGPASPDALFTLAARVPLDDGGGSVRIGVPRTEIREGDPLSRVLASLTDMRIAGTLEGGLSLPLDAPERGEARLALFGARVREVDGAGVGEGVRGELRFERLAPLETRAPARLVWDHLEIGGVKLDEGSGRLAFAAPGDVLVSDVRAGFAGGELEVAPFRFARKAPDVPLDLRLRGIDLENVLQALTDGRITGHGKLDGRVALRVELGDERRLSLGDGRLTSRGRGGLQLRMDTPNAGRELGLQELIDGSFLRRRVMGAMEDFEYRSLTLNVSEAGTKHVQARVVGRGKRMPQELDLTLNIRGVQPLLDRAIRLWPDRLDASIEMGQK